MSGRNLSTAEISLLKKGLKFTPTPKGNTSELKTDINEFCRKLRLSELFFIEDKDDKTEEPLVRNKTGWQPPRSNDNILEDTIQIIKGYPIDSAYKRSNLNRQETDALKTLTSDTSIIIKEADKGGAVVVMDAGYYRDKLLQMLTDEEFYSETDEGMDNKTRKMINKLVENHGGGLYKEEAVYLTNFKHDTSYFYGLPKIHKSKTITDAIKVQQAEYVTVFQPTDLKFRPIVGGPNSSTQRLSHLLDLILKPVCPEVPSFIRDDIDFLQHLPKTTDTEAILTTFDVVSLYTNIPHDLGEKAIRYWLNKCGDKVNSRFKDTFIIEGMKIVLQRNVFYFDGKFYIQNTGTAMGTKVAPTYATLVIGYLEEELFQKLHNKYGADISCYYRDNWSRFLDDCFIIWTINSMSIATFWKELNSLHPKIQFTMETSENQLPFLDVLVKLCHGVLSTDIYFKPTDTHLYLNFKSCHPKHTKTNIPFCLASRVVTIVSDTNQQEMRLAELKQFLKKQNYPDKLIENGIERAITKGPITGDGNNQSKGNTNVIPLVTTFNPCNTNVLPFVRNCQTILKQSSRMKTILEKSTIVNSKRQSKNLKRLLTTSKFEFHSTPARVSKCIDKRCKTCPDLLEGTDITFTNGKRFKVKRNMSCHSSYVIYTLICKKCGEFYVGKTSNMLKTRMTIHRQQTRNDELRMLKVNKHFHSCSNGKFNIFPIYCVSESNDCMLEEKEKLFIEILKPSLNA